MSEELLRALMQLFALASNDDDLTQESRTIVELFLQAELGPELVPVYLDQYDSFVTHYQAPGNETRLVNPDSVRKICADINQNLVQKQKFIVLVRLLEYIFADGNISDHELEFLRILSDSFNIAEDEFEAALRFSRSTEDTIEDDPHLLCITGQHELPFQKTKVMHVHHFEGSLLIVNFASVKLFTMRYFGSGSLHLNGQFLERNRTYVLTNGSAIRSNKINPIYYSDILSNVLIDETDEKLAYRVSDIEYTFPNGRKGLHQLSFSEQSGKLIGIMGGSGAGKSTLLNVLNGTYEPSSGSVTINGKDIYRNRKELEGVIGYVSQDDLLMEDLTVFQNLYYNAQLCLANLSDEEITVRVNELLESLGLSESKDLRVGNPIDKVISGGQRKRLNIALELIREPSVLFVDEPTSGLSSRDSENIMDLLKQLALKGKLLFVVIHQPSSDIFKMFDKLCILDLGGYPIYYGDPVESIIYFKQQTHQVNSNESECLSCGNVNPEQVFNIIEAKVVDEYGNTTSKRKVPPQRWNEAFRDSRMGLETLPPEESVPPRNLHVPNMLGQFAIFLKRDVLSKFANRQYMLINFLEAPVLALLLSYFIKFSAGSGKNEGGYTLWENENLPAYLFMAVIVALFIGLTVSAEEIIRDQRIRKRERFLNLSKGSYLLSKVAILFTLSAIQTLTFVWIGNAIMEIEGMNLIHWTILFSTAAFANMLGLNISSSFNSAVTIYILIPFLIIPQLIFSGVIVKFDKLNPDVSARSHVPFIGEVMASRWAFEALAVTQFKDNPLERELYGFDKQLSIINYRKIYWLPEITGKLNTIAAYNGNDEEREQIEREVALLQTELASPDANLDYPALDFAYAFGNDVENEASLAKTETYLKKLKRYLNQQNRKWTDKRDARVLEIDNLEEGGYFVELKQRHTNKSLTDLVTRKTEFPKIIEVDGLLIQRENPIYHDAEAARAHFYAPTKLLFGSLLDTLWFNLGVLWLMSLTLGLTLYTDALRKLLLLFRRIKR